MTLALAMILDALMGEPRPLWSRIPHPAVLMGQWIAFGTRHLNEGPFRTEKGVALVLASMLLASIIGWGLSQFGMVIEAVAVAVLLAHRSLIDHVARVADGLRMSVAQARRDVAKIVGRDTESMDAPAITRAAVESAAENFADGVIAPAFWFMVAGLPGILIYKMVNTADSMIGYKTAEFEDFGWAAARLDDLLNWVPARLTMLLIALPHGLSHTLHPIASDAGLHRSPNAGWPEAAMARAIDLALSGPRSYDGKLQDFPWVHAGGRKGGGPSDIEAALRVLWISWAVALGVVCIGDLLF